MLEITTRADELNHMILNGQGLDAFEKFYADGCTMQENSEPPVVGKDANRKREEAFFASIEAFHGAELRASAANDNVDFSEWMLDVTLKGAGRIRMEQVAVRRWEDGQVVAERFYYNKS